jgi:hypothetical protein
VSAFISLALARELQQAGLVWTPTPLDFFVIPERGLDDKIFVISDMLVTVERVEGQPVFMFQGAMEWALDYVTTGEAVWLPRESQLREVLTALLAAEPSPALALIHTPPAWRCEIRWHGEAGKFVGGTVSEAYGAALLHVLRNS